MFLAQSDIELWPRYGSVQVSRRSRGIGDMLYYDEHDFGSVADLSK